MIERRLSFLIAGLVVFFVSAVLWNVSAPTRRPARAGGAVDSTTLVTVRADTTRATPGGASDTTVTRGGQSPAPTAPPLSADASGPSYMELLARSETRRRIRASAGYTYLNEVVAQSKDSMLHRWDNRILTPVRVFLGPSTAANFQPGFLDAVRRVPTLGGGGRALAVPLGRGLGGGRSALQVEAAVRDPAHRPDRPHLGPGRPARERR